MTKLVCDNCGEEMKTDMAGGIPYHESFVTLMKSLKPGDHCEYAPLAKDRYFGVIDIKGNKFSVAIQAQTGQGRCDVCDNCIFASIENQLDPRNKPQVSADF